MHWTKSSYKIKDNTFISNIKMNYNKNKFEQMLNLYLKNGFVLLWVLGSAS